MNTFVHHGLTLEYQVRGEGTPLIFLHGMGGGIGQISSTYDLPEGIQLIVPSQQGHGNSDMNIETFGFQTLADDVLALSEILGLEKFYLAGISMGAAVSLTIAEMAPEKVLGMILIRNAWTDRPMSREVQRAYADMAAGLKAGNLEIFQKTEGWKLVEGPSAYTRNAFTAPFSEKSALRWWQKYEILPKDTPVKEIHGYDVPVSILACRGDFVHVFEYGQYLHERMPGSRFVEIPNKDEDPKAHKDIINQVINEMIL